MVVRPGARDLSVRQDVLRLGPGDHKKMRRGEWFVWRERNSRNDGQTKRCVNCQVAAISIPNSSGCISLAEAYRHIESICNERTPEVYLTAPLFYLPGFRKA